MIIQHIQLRRGRGWLGRRRLWAAKIAHLYINRKVRIRTLMRRFDLRAAEVHAAIAHELQPEPLQKLIPSGEDVYVFGSRHRALDVALDHIKEGKGLQTIAAERQLSFAQIHAALSYYYDLYPEEDNGYTANLHELIEKLLRRGKTPPVSTFSITGAISSTVSSGWISIIVVAAAAGALNTAYLDEMQDYLRDASREVTVRVDDAQDQISEGYDELFPPPETDGNQPGSPVNPRATATPSDTPTPFQPRPTGPPTWTPTWTPTRTPTATATATATPYIIQ